MALVSSALVARQGAKEASKISKKSLGFDFIPLLTSLILYYVIAFFNCVMCDKTNLPIK